MQPPTVGCEELLDIDRGPVDREAESFLRRFVSVYAPGLKPMDFHAVTEVWLDGAWQLFDATGLAPRQAMVRICTGRDAADTAFMTTLGGRTQLESVRVDARIDGDLPSDDGLGLRLLS